MNHLERRFARLSSKSRPRPPNVYPERLQWYNGGVSKPTRVRARPCRRWSYVDNGFAGPFYRHDIVFDDAGVAAYFEPDLGVRVRGRAPSTARFSSMGVRR